MDRLRDAVRFVDVGPPLVQRMAVYAGDPEFAIAAWPELAGSPGFRVSALRLGTHTGTHVDAPLHCLLLRIAGADGAPARVVLAYP